MPPTDATDASRADSPFGVVTVGEIAAPPGPSLAADCTIGEARRRLVETDTDRAFLVDAGGRPVALLTAAGLLRAACLEADPDGPAVSIACRGFARVEADRPVAEVAGLFREEYRERLAVTAAGRLAGVVRRLDVLRLLARDRTNSESRSAAGPPAPHFLTTATTPSRVTSVG